MEENKQENTSIPENQVAPDINPSARKKEVVTRRSAVKKTAVQPEVEVKTISTELEASNEVPPMDALVEIEYSTYQYPEKLDEKNLKKLKKMNKKMKEEEKKAKNKQKEKEKKAKKKKKEKAKKEKAKKKLKEKKAKKKASLKKKKSKK